MLLNHLPRLDLHGETTPFVTPLVNEFINDHLKMKNKEIVIIHGRSSNILAKEVHKVLKSNKKVKAFKYNNWNLGETVVLLDVK